MELTLLLPPADAARLRRLPLVKAARDRALARPGRADRLA